jgi:hypothetical protein
VCSTPRGPNLLPELWVFGTIRILRFFFRIQVIEISEELVETVRGRKKLIPIAEMVLAELAAYVTERLQDVRDGRVFRLQAKISAGEPDLGKAGSDG